jgi:hypothetical protein
MSNVEQAVSEAARPAPKPAPKLRFVKPSEDPNVNVFLYGPPKTGKTMGAASAPKPMLYVNADKPNATRLAHSKFEFDEVKMLGLEETLIPVMEELLRGEYRTVVIDPLSSVYRTLLEGISGRALSPSLPQYQATGVHLERFCRRLCELPLNAVFVAHELTVEDGEALERLAYTGTKNPVFGLNLMAEVDVIGYTGVVEKEGGDREYVAQLVNGRGRRGGDRFDVLGISRSLDLSEWIDLARTATAK